MKLLDHVAIGARIDAPTPLVLRSVLRQLGVRAHLYRSYQTEHVRDPFARKGVSDEVPFTVMCAHAGGPDEDPAIHYVGRWIEHRPIRSGQAEGRTT